MGPPRRPVTRANPRRSDSCSSPAHPADVAMRRASARFSAGEELHTSFYRCLDDPIPEAGSTNLVIPEDRLQYAVVQSAGRQAGRGSRRLPNACEGLTEISSDRAKRAPASASTTRPPHPQQGSLLRCFQAAAAPQLPLSRAHCGRPASTARAWSAHIFHPPQDGSSPIPEGAPACRSGWPASPARCRQAERASCYRPCGRSD